MPIRYQRIEQVIGLGWEEINALVLKARETEHYRIIKLLEEHHDSFSWQHSTISQDNCYACESLNLIKGENK
jgi:hypothetical protein